MKKQYFHAPEQKEETKHGEPYFPVQKYITRLSEEYPAVTTHWHEEAELTLIVKGKCHYHVDLVDYEVKEGDLLFVPPLFLHAISKGRCEEFISETYVFHLNFLGGNSTDICSTRYLVPIMNQEFAMPCLITGKHSVYASLRKVFDQITSLYDENVDGYELALKALLLQAIFCCCNIVKNYKERKRATF